MNKHTPTPWMVAGTTVYAIEHHGWHKGIEQFQNRFSAGVQGPGAPAEELEANAAYIVRAVNAHERLVRALELAESYLVERGIEYKGNTGRTIVLPAIRAALSAAKE